MADRTIEPRADNLIASRPPQRQAAMEKLGEVANSYAASGVFERFLLRRAEHTLRRHIAGLARFAAFLDRPLGQAGIDLMHEAVVWYDQTVTARDLEGWARRWGAVPVDLEPLSEAALQGLVGVYFQRCREAWRGVTWGLVQAFVDDLLHQGYAVSSINVHLSTVKSYARLAAAAGTLTKEELALIQNVQSFRKAEQPRIDEKRPVTRVGRKKARPTKLTVEQALALKRQPDTPQGRRDALILCLLLDHGLRVGEVAGLAVEDLDLHEGLLRFYRPKVNKVQLHLLTEDSLRAAQAYLRFDAHPKGLLLRGSRKNRELVQKPGISTVAISERVRTLGEELGVIGLSAHDCRHYWATRAAKMQTPFEVLRQAGGWSSAAMPLRYIEETRIANKDVTL